MENAYPDTNATSQSRADNVGIRVPEYDELVRLKQQQLIYSQYSALPFIGIAGSILLTVLLYNHVSSENMLVWCSFAIFTYLVAVPITNALCGRRNETARDTRIALKYAALLALVEGLTWGSSAFLLFPAESVFHQLTLLCFMIGAASVTAISNTAYRPTFIIQIISILGPFVLVFLLQMKFEYTVISIGVCTFVLVLIHFNKYIYNSIIDSIYLNYLYMEKKNQAEDARKAQTNFFAAVSHDMRQPLHAYGLLVKSLNSYVTDDKPREILKTMAKSTKGMRALLDSLLDISRLDAGVLKADMHNFKLQPLIDQIFLEYEELANSRGIMLAARSMDVEVYSDRIFVERILRNIVHNAIVHSEAKSILVAVRFRKNGNLLVEVRDSGKGIPSEYLLSIFDEYKQVSTADNENGLGLGLSIVNRLAKLLGTTVQLRSCVNHGSCFYFEVPPALRDKTRYALGMEDQKGILPGKRVFVIDDEVSVLNAMRYILESWYCNVSIFSSAALSIEEVKSTEIPPDIIISDYRLQENTGISVIHSIRKMCNRQIPALIITGDTGIKEIQEYYESDIDVLFKPVDSEQLKMTLEQLLTQSVSS